jgi:hypothetical protein
VINKSPYLRQRQTKVPNEPTDWKLDRLDVSPPMASAFNSDLVAGECTNLPEIKHGYLGPRPHISWVKPQLPKGAVPAGEGHVEYI